MSINDIEHLTIRLRASCRMIEHLDPVRGIVFAIMTSIASERAKAYESHWEGDIIVRTETNHPRAEGEALPVSANPPA